MAARSLTRSRRLTSRLVAGVQSASSFAKKEEEEGVPVVISLVVMCVLLRAYAMMAVFFSSSFSFATPPSTTTAGGAGPQAEGLLVPQVASNSEARQRSNSRTPHALISDWPAYPLKHTLLAARVVFMNTHHHPNAAFMNTGRCNTRGS